MNPSSEKLLLHVCCAPCAVGCVERLLGEERELALFFSNANIAPDAEYQRRLDAVRDLAGRYRLPLVEDDCRHADWLVAAASGFEAAPEGGARCGRCFGFSLRRAAAAAAQLGIGRFTTSLTVSPHKNSNLIFTVGAAFAGFEPIDFKKRDGFRRSRELAKEYGFYLQTYCGCEFSLPQSAASSSSSSSGG
jgi:hypothetical protein